MRCDPVMMAGLGGPLPREGIEDKVARDVQAAAAGEAWIKMIIPGETVPDVVAGAVTLWSHHEAASRCLRSAGWSCRNSRDAGSPSGSSGCFSSWPADPNLEASQEQVLTRQGPHRGAASGGLSGGP